MSEEAPLPPRSRWNSWPTQACKRWIALQSCCTARAGILGSRGTVGHAFDSGLTALAEGDCDRSGDLLGNGHNRGCLAGRDIWEIGRVASVYCPLLEPLEVENADIRPNGLGLQRDQHDQVVRVAELDAGVDE